MGLDLADMTAVQIQGDAADHILNLIDDGYHAGGRIEETRTIYPKAEGLPFSLKAEYADNQDLNGYTVGCVLTHDGEDVTAEYIEGITDVIRSHFNSMDVEIVTQEGKPGVELVFLTSGR